MTRNRANSRQRITPTFTLFRAAPIPQQYSESRMPLPQYALLSVLTRRTRSCNRQISAAELLVKDADVTRSTVQKAVVVLASKPVFGLIR